jgi:hypothetical protein
LTALAGCGGEKQAAAVAVKSQAATATPTPSDTTTTETGEATVAQYASLLARQKASMGKSLDEMLGDHCDWGTPGSVDTRPGYMTCGIGVLSINLQAQTLHAVLDGSAKPGVPAYIGAPPAEIKSLVDETMTAADTLAATSDKATKCTSDDAAGCTATLFDFERAMDDLQTEFAAWSPYGV